MAAHVALIGGVMRSLAVGTFLNFCFLLIVGLICLGVGASDARANEAWKSLRGHSVCGGLDESGRLQPKCDYQPAKYIGKAINQCRPGTFNDLGTCWACPEGYDRTANKIDGDRACSKPADKVLMSKATFKGRVKCPSGSVFDLRNGGECWKCDPGFSRTAAPVTEWNACGKLGQQARDAEFVGRACPTEGAFLDPQYGGECWVCPPGYDRTLNPVNSASACKLEVQFSKALDRGEFRCKPGETFDLIDGGTCWKCPDEYKRNVSSVKSKDACFNDNMEWAVPKRQIYGLFGLGWGANDILAKAIAERTKIDATIKAFATVNGLSESASMKESWDIIEKTPWDSPMLSSLLQEAAMEAALKPENQRSAAEKDLVARVEQLIQWNRQFIAYQAKQALDNWKAATEAFHQKQMENTGAAVIWSDNVITPPDYNHALTAAIQTGAFFAGPAGVIVTTNVFPAVMHALRPYAFIKATKAAAAAATKAATEGAKVAATAVSSTSPSVVAAAAGPTIIVAALAVVMTMELDKFLEMAKAEGKIANAIRKAERPVDLGTLLTSQGGPDEFLFHWAAVIGEKVKPNADYEARFVAYKTGKAELAGKPTTPVTKPDSPTIGNIPGALTAEQMGDVRPNQINLPGMPGGTSGAAPTAGTTTGPETMGVVPNPSSAQPKTFQAKKVTKERSLELALAAVNDELQNQNGPERPSAFTRGPRVERTPIEFTNQPGQCMGKKAGDTVAISLSDCGAPNVMKIGIDSRGDRMTFGENLCLRVTIPDDENMSGPVDASLPPHLVVTECWRSVPDEQSLQPSREGYIKMGRSGKCLTVSGKGDDQLIVAKPCGSDAKNQIWRPLAQRR